jgi:membrane-associated phospholipid phosphatase
MTRARVPLAGCSLDRMRAMGCAVAWCGVLAVSASAPAGSQAPASGPVITGRDLALVAGATAGAAAVSLYDVRIARAFGDSSFHARHPGFTSASRRASVATETVLMLTGGTIYTIARIRKDDGTADVALHTTESVASAAIFIQLVRGVLGRARPWVVNEVGEIRDADPYDFEPFHGFTSFDYRSFPSMHAMASFAVASALAQEMRLRDTRHRAAVAPVLYAAAALPALSRMYLDEHWASDIAMGAFLGVLAGQKVVLYSHDHPDNRVDNALLHRRLTLTVTRDASGFGLSVLPF